MLRLVCLLLAMLSYKLLFAQDTAYLQDKSPYLHSSYIEAIDRKATTIERGLSKKTNKYLRELSREEERLRRKLNGIDSNAAKEIFGKTKESYKAFQIKLSRTSEKINSVREKYRPLVDSLKTSLNFLQEFDSFNDKLSENEKLEKALSSVEQLQDKLNSANHIVDFIRNRREFLDNKLAAFGLLKDLRKYKEKAYYLKAQIQEYEQLLHEPDELIVKSLSILRETPAFISFFKQHSELASLFCLPGDQLNSGAAAIPGLQTRSSVQNLVQQRFGAIGTGEQQDLTDQVNNAQSQLAELKDKVKQMGNSSDELPMPNFNPNSEKTKSFWRRLEYGSNIQSVKPNGFFPITTDLGLSLGYKLSEKAIIGVGASYKVGWGQSINNINVTHQGVGLRSFVDIKIKGTFFISGGAELNYRNQIRDVEELKNYTAWQRSALIGLTKKYRINKKFKGNIQLLYDFLHDQQVPKTTPVLFRLGYNF